MFCCLSVLLPERFVAWVFYQAFCRLSISSRFVAWLDYSTCPTNSPSMPTPMQGTMNSQHTQRLLHPHMHDLGTPYARHTPLLNIMHCLTNNDIKNILGVILGYIFSGTECSVILSKMTTHTNIKMSVLTWQSKLSTLTFKSFHVIRVLFLKKCQTWQLVRLVQAS